NKNKGIETLLNKAIELAESDYVVPKKRKVKYSKDIEDSILIIEHFLENHAANSIPYNVRWTAIKLIEDDKIVKERILEKTGKVGDDILKEVDNQRNFLVDRFDDDPEIVMTDERYGFIAGIIMEVLTTSTKQRVDISRNVDLVLTNRFVGFPIFIFFIWAMFQLTFSLGAYPMDWISSGINLFSTLLTRVLPDHIFKDFLINGIIAGVGSVVIFLPNILILFFCIALFEDTGYMSRAAFLMDKIMHLIGLHGKSFIPMLMGFGCNVPAIMASRTLESEKDRTLTILITPFMSCSARLPVYIILAGAFFGAKAGTVIFGIYLLGIILSIVTGRLFRSTLLRGADAPFVMELPPYRIPMIKSLLIHMWDRSKLFLKKMGGYILAGSVVVWTLTAFPLNISYSKNYDLEIKQIKTYFQTEMDAAQESDRALLAQKRDDVVRELITEKKAEKAEKSFMGRIGKVIAPIFSPIGIDWRGSVALLSGFVAKEIVVSTMGILYAADEREDSEALKNALLSSGMTPIAALAMMVFVLLYMPCIATLAAIRRETASLKWMIFSISYSTLLAWGMAFLVYQCGTLIGI
ncbi:MAG: ferrous iron transport protein B, partial [Deltaproteobacteria bacterium]|nr:ferrous iron transport protein B [Deltaproteobacteria bacterium]